MAVDDRTWHWNLNGLAELMESIPTVYDPVKFTTKFALANATMDYTWLDNTNDQMYLRLHNRNHAPLEIPTQLKPIDGGFIADTLVFTYKNPVEETVQDVVVISSRRMQTWMGTVLNTADGKLWLPDTVDVKGSGLVRRTSSTEISCTMTLRGKTVVNVI